jgi:limonene-1,2-epoxide hydrolase
VVPALNNYSAAMSSGEIVSQFIGAIERRDLNVVEAMLAEEISYENMPMRPIVGREAVMKVIEAFLAPAELVDWKILRQWECEGVVVNERIDRFRIGNGWLELPVAGFFELDSESRILLWRDYFDLGSYTSQMAALTS